MRSPGVGARSHDQAGGRTAGRTVGRTVGRAVATPHGGASYSSLGVGVEAHGNGISGYVYGERTQGYGTVGGHGTAESYLSGRYNQTFSRLDQGPGYANWYADRGYGARSFGVGYGLSQGYYGTGSGARSHGIGYGHADSSYYGFASLGAQSGHYSGYGSHLGGVYGGHSYYYPSVYPWYSGIGYYSGVGYYGGGGYYNSVPDYEVENNTYETNNYYLDSEGASYRQTPPANLYGRDALTVPADPQQASHRLNGMRAFNAGDFDLARREFVRAMVAEPEDPELIMLYGYAHFATGDYLIAALAVRRALQADATLVDHPVDIVQFYGDPAMFEQHLAKLEAHLTKQATDLDARFLAGFMRYASGRPAEAQAYFARCVADDSSDLLYFVMRDAALRAEVILKASRNDGSRSDGARGRAEEFTPTLHKSGRFRLRGWA